MLINTSKIKKGLYFEKNSKYYKIIDFLHVKPGKGNAFIRTTIKNLNDGNIIKNTFPSGSKINKINLKSRRYKYIYKNNEDFVFINKQNFNTLSLSEKFLNKYYYFLKKNDEVEIVFIKESNIPLFIKKNKYSILKVIDTSIDIRGNTVKNKLKKVFLETGLYIYAPYFIKQGDYIKVNTSTFKYIERISNYKE